MICKKELKMREEEAKENMINIIGSLEERGTQESPGRKRKHMVERADSSDSEDLLKNFKL